MKNKLSIGAAICSVIALSASHASASGITAVDEDLLLCFQATSGQGSGLNLEVDLGNYASPASSLNLSSELSTVYGSTWYNNSTLTWAVVGGDTTDFGTPVNYDTVWVTSPGAGPTPQSASYQDGLTGDTSGMYAELGSSNATQLASDAASISTADTSSYTGVLTDFTNAFGGIATGAGFGSSGNDSNGLWQLQPDQTSADPAEGPASSKELDVFTLNGNGVFTTSAVPEPSTWASIALGAATLIGLRRRRKA